MPSPLIDTPEALDASGDAGASGPGCAEAAGVGR
jgi:hypothetical protein